MKMRHHRKRKQALFRRHRAFLWSTQRVMNVVVKASMKLSAAMEAAYAKSRQSMRDEAEVERIMVDIWQPVNGFGFKLKEQE
jgi:hypothetical protein